MAAKGKATKRSVRRGTPMVRKPGVTRNRGRILCKGGKLKKR